jgi:hypothetical protein
MLAYRRVAFYNTGLFRELISLKTTSLKMRYRRSHDNVEIDVERRIPMKRDGTVRLWFLIRQ